MPEQADNATTTQTQTAKQPVKLGAVERVTMTFPQEGQENNSNTVDNSSDQSANQSNEGANAIKDANEAAVVDKTAAAPTFTDQQLKEYFKTQGIEYEGVDKLKDQLKPKDTALAPTEEQIKAKELAQEKRRLDKFISGGGTAEQYVALKSVAEAPIEELSKNTLKKELKDAKFSDAEIDAIIKERYYQIDDEELEQLDDESDKAFKKRSKEYFANKLANRSLPIKNQAAGILAGIQEAINAEDLREQNELSISANIDEQFKVVNLKDTYEIGNINGKAIPPIESEVPEAEINAIHQMLRDPAQRQQLLFNQDGTSNITKIKDLLIENAKLKAAMKTSYHEGSTRTNAAWEKVFPARSAQELGVGGNQQRPNGQNGSKIAGVGKVQRVQPQRQ